MNSRKFDKIQRARALLARAASVAVLGALAACAVSQASEVQMGANYAGQIAQQLPLIKDPEALRYINALGNSLARVTDQRSLSWHFNIVDSKEVNAFAVPGGYIYVNRGLIERAQSMSQLAGVLGHEIGHVTLRHSIKQSQSAQGANAGVSLACILIKVCDNAVTASTINIVAGGVFAHYSRVDETEADHEGVSTTVKAGIDPHGVPQMLRILLEERKTNPGAVDAFFATHPLEEDRITTTDAQIAAYPPRQLEGLARDTKEFHAFRDRMAGLPASPDSKKKN